MHMVHGSVSQAFAPLTFHMYTFFSSFCKFFASISFYGTALVALSNTQYIIKELSALKTISDVIFMRFFFI